MCEVLVNKKTSNNIKQYYNQSLQISSRNLVDYKIFITIKSPDTSY